MEEQAMKFEEKLKTLVGIGKKKKNILELQEINDVFSDMELEAEQMDKIFEYLEAQGIDVLRMTEEVVIDDLADDLPDDIDLMLVTEEDDVEVDMESISLCRTELALKTRFVCI